MNSAVLHLLCSCLFPTPYPGSIKLLLQLSSFSVFQIFSIRHVNQWHLFLQRFVHMLCSLSYWKFTSDWGIGRAWKARWRWSFLEYMLIWGTPSYTSSKRVNPEKATSTNIFYVSRYISLMVFKIQVAPSISALITYIQCALHYLLCIYVCAWLIFRAYNSQTLYGVFSSAVESQLWTRSCWSHLVISIAMPSSMSLV